MLSTKKPSLQFHPQHISLQNQQKTPQLNFQKIHSQNLISTLSQPFNLNLNVQEQELFLCFQCSNQNLSQTCNECKGTGFLKANHPLVQLMNQIFNAKFISYTSKENGKNLISAKTSSKSDFSDSLISCEKISNSIEKNSTKSNQQRQKQIQKSSILGSLLNPLQTIIKEESTLDGACKKCNICRFQFDSVKYTCGQCQNFNVCEQCYRTKRISHCHELKKIQSLKSQKTGQNDVNFDENLNLQSQKIASNKQQQFPQSDVDKLSIKSDDQVELIINKMKTKQQNSQQKHKHQNLNFFQLHQVQLQHKDDKLCNNCQIKIQDCYWICETCKQKATTYQLCKHCYDNQLYEHPKQHRLGLNFFDLNQNFLLSDSIFFDHINENTQENKHQDTFSFQKTKHQTEKPQKSFPISQNSNLRPTQSMPQMSNIGKIKHKDIFTGFHKENENQDYQNEIISPIPKSIKLLQSFKEQKKQNLNIYNAQDAEMIVDLLNSSVNTTPKKSIKKETDLLKPNVQTFLDQSKVQFDQNMIMDLGLSQQYTSKQPKQRQNQQWIQLYNSENKSVKLKEVKKKQKNVNLFPNMTLQEINPETSILGINQQQDYFFTQYHCDICGIHPIKNIKYHCLECEDYDLCQDCFNERRVEHWHEHFRRDDRRQRLKKIFENKQKVITKAVNDLNRSVSPSRRSFFYLK